ncbi:MAG: hypothetical protein OIF54_14440, partial [Cohaesibacter sp.]|nr:hypothetical protein [Cohaesibacter sp.]
GRELGKVGSTIIAEVFGGLLAGDPTSYVRLWPNWTPANDPDILALFKEGEQNPVNEDDWQVGDLLRASGAPINPDDVQHTIEHGRNRS